MTALLTALHEYCCYYHLLDVYWYGWGTRLRRKEMVPVHTTERPTSIRHASYTDDNHKTDISWP